MKTSMQNKPSIVFAHGIWADGSCFQKVIPTLRAEGHEVMAAQYGLDTLKGDVDATIRTFGRVSGPIVLVGHSYGGTVITHAGLDPRLLLSSTSRPWVRMRPRHRRANRTSSRRRTSSSTWKSRTAASGCVLTASRASPAIVSRGAGGRLCDPLRASPRFVHPEA